ncbi:MAG: hypothetical protein HC781_03085 [Leptolyngbyaceae cyanobacterium CSU_1_4]|nr:hypothetical protein [Leptolyngbyaceae cyanobacterium CSU_1_4]
MNTVEITTLQTKPENSFEQISYSVETGTAKLSDSVQSSFSPVSTTAEVLENQTSVQQFTEASVEPGRESAIDLGQKVSDQKLINKRHFIPQFNLKFNLQFNEEESIYHQKVSLLLSLWLLINLFRPSYPSFNKHRLGLKQHLPTLHLFL